MVVSRLLISPVPASKEKGEDARFATNGVPIDSFISRLLELYPTTDRNDGNGQAIECS